MISVNLNTNGEKISTAEGNINFNKDELEVTALSKEGSILTSWDIEPSFSNDEGIIRFGGLTASGYRGIDGKILSVSFKALKNKASTVRFATGAAVIAADGQGTNILTGMDAGLYELTPAEVIPSLIAMTPAQEETLASSTPIASFTIVSATHPDPTRFSATTTAMFEWKWEGDVSSIAFSLDDKPTTSPKNIYTSPLTKKVFKNLSDGVYFFHFKRSEANGSSTLIHYRIGIDTAVPEHFAITKAATANAYGFSFDAADAGSGIEKYAVAVDRGKEETWIDDGSHIYKPSGISSGTHTLNATAFDVAGNFISETFSFTVPVVLPPTFIEKPKKVTIGAPINLSFKAEAGAKVRVVIETSIGEKKERDATKVKDGIFAFTVTEHAIRGTYTVSAIADIKGVDSTASEKIIISAEGGFGYFANTAFHLLKTWALQIFIVIFIIFIFLRGFMKMKKKDKKISTGGATTSRITFPVQNPPGDVRPSNVHRESVKIVAPPTEENSFQVRIEKRT